MYGFFRKDMKQSSYSKAVARGLLALPVGAIVNALGAIAFGAPVGTRVVNLIGHEGSPVLTSGRRICDGGFSLVVVDAGRARREEKGNSECGGFWVLVGLSVYVAPMRSLWPNRD
nr:phosphatidylinositol-glycan biosynthesis class F protein-like [Tanacetum cinerariifolium]